jgi:hypothetical protein
MGNISNWHQEKHPDFLLIDNSIVLGGNPINLDDKLGPSWKRNWVLHGVVGRRGRLDQCQ